MTLLIACLLIYNFDMSGWWYIGAVALWLAEYKSWDEFIKSNVEHLKATTACRYRELSL